MVASDLLGGRYQILGVIRHGGMATVHDGWDTRLARPVAIKVLHPALGSDAGARARFEFEARSAAALNHPNIVVVHDFGQEHGQAYLIMERLPGHSLVDALVRGPLPPDRVRAVLSDVLAGLGAAHAAGIMHRDIKPANIVFDPAGTAKIADFGIAKTGGTGTDLTRAGEMVGTMAYLSPDRIAGRAATPLDDLYAVGAVGYELLTGRMPYPQTDPAALVRAIADHQLAPLRVVRPDVEPALVAVIDRAMAASHRFPDAETMRAALHSVRPSTRVLPAPSLPPPRPRGRRRKVLAALAIGAVFLLALVLVIAVTITSHNDSAPPTYPSTPRPSETYPSETYPSETYPSETYPSETTQTFAPVPQDGPRFSKPRGSKHVDDG